MNDSTINENNLNDFMSIYETVVGKIYEITDLNSRIDGRYYDLKEIFVTSSDCFDVEVEYHVGGDYYDRITIQIHKDLLLDKNKYEYLKMQAKIVEDDRLKERILNEKNSLEKKLQETRDLLAKHGG